MAALPSKKSNKRIKPDQLCIKYQQGTCNNTDCKYIHLTKEEIEHKNKKIKKIKIKKIKIKIINHLDHHQKI